MFIFKNKASGLAPRDQGQSHHSADALWGVS